MTPPDPATEQYRPSLLQQQEEPDYAPLGAVIALAVIGWTLAGVAVLAVMGWLA